MPTERDFAAIGVDGCKGGWFFVRISPAGVFESGVVADLECLLDTDEKQRILVDIPIGLPTDASARQCDTEARARLGALKRSVFPVPVRAVLCAASYDHARSLSKKAQGGKSISQQTWSIVPKIKKVDHLMRRGYCNVLEVHPEVCFWALNGEKPLDCSKKTHNGFWERLAILEGVCPGIGCELKAMDTRVAPDDVLDAAVAAVTATVPEEALRSVPDRPPKDSCGLPMRMVYATREDVLAG